MYIKAQINEPNLKPCPFCNNAVILVSTVQFEKAEDDGYKILCDCGWAGRQLRKWYGNKTLLIKDWNNLINDES